MTSQSAANTSSAACGSFHIFASANSVTFPPEKTPPPIITIDLTFDVIVGSCLKAIAIFVRGPTGHNIISPILAFIRSQIYLSAGTLVGFAFGKRAGISPNPSLPCT